MPLESASFINQLVQTNPVSADPVSQGDDHIRLIKAVLKTTFPNLNAAVTASPAELNKLDGTSVTTADLNKLNQVTATAAELNKLGGFTGSTEDLNRISGASASSGPGVIPPGGIIMWSGSVANIPAGWALCNGANGTPNLRDRFIVGAGGGYAVGATGGAATVALTWSQMPAHSHSFSGTTSAGGSHQHEIPHMAGIAPWGATGNVSSNRYLRTDGGTLNNTLTAPVGDHIHTFSGTTSSAGSGSAHENRPPYYALCFIMKL